MKFLKQILLVLLALLMLLMVLFYLTPLDAYVPEVERALAKQLHEPVSIQHLRIAIVPLPHIELESVRLTNQDGFAVRAISLEPDFVSMLAGRKLMWRVVVKDGGAEYSQLRKLVEQFYVNPVVASKMTVSELQMSGMTLQIPKMSLGPIEGKLEFAQNGKLERAWFAMDDQKVVVSAKPLPDRRFAMTLDAQAWSPPQSPKIIFDSLQVDGVLSEHDFVAQKFAVALRGIRADGSGAVEYSDGWHIQSKLSNLDMPLEQMIAMTGVSHDLTGNLRVDGKLDCEGTALSELKNNFQFSGNVSIKNAAYRMAAEFKQPLLFDEVDAHVVAQADRIVVSALVAKLYDGQVTGNAVVTHKDSLLKADAWASNISMKPLVEALTNEVLFRGRMDGSAKLSMHLESTAHFPENMQLDGNFHLRNGVLSKVDLVQAVSNPGKIPERIGTTRFDDLTGLLNVDTSGLHFRKIQMASGSINASGRVDVSSALQLNGALDADIKGTAGLVSMPMVISGTINKPIVRPSGTALAGAAVGTAILGPGLGTALGIRIGGFLNKVFGSQDDKGGAENVGQLPLPGVPAKN